MCNAAEKSDDLHRLRCIRPEECLRVPIIQNRSVPSFAVVVVDV